MKKIMLLLSMLLTSCAAFIPPTPNDFPPPPTTIGIMPPPVTVIVEFPNVTATPKIEMFLHPIMPSDMSDARTFLLIIKTQIAAGNDYGFAEMVHYPIQVGLEGKMKVITTQDEFLQNYKVALNDKVINALNTTNEDSLIILPEGIRVGNGELWFNLFCVDAACSDTKFLVTQINN